jgi:hypothetical protein
MGNSLGRDGVGECLDNVGLAYNILEALRPPFTCQYDIRHDEEFPAAIDLLLPSEGKREINLNLA